MARYRSRPITMEAVQWTGANWDEVRQLDPAGRNLRLTRWGLEVTGPDGDWRLQPFGTWVGCTDDGHFVVVSDEAFRYHFERVTDDESGHRA